MRILVMGAGVVGVASAWYLARAGHEVTVVDRQPAAGLETSFANGGQISVSHAEPWANPHTPLRALAWLGREDAPLLFRLRWDPALFDWSWRFLKECLPSRTRDNIRDIVTLALYSRSRLKALSATRTALVGGDYTAADESGDAMQFTNNLAMLCRQRGVVFRYNTTVEKLEAKAGAVSGAWLKSAGGRKLAVADAYVVALGSYSPLLLRGLGLRLPVYPAKGYSATIKLSRASVAPTVAMTDDGHKLVFSRLGERLRIAGTAEFNGYNTELNALRCEALVRRTRQLFPELRAAGEPEFWCGLRPATPSSVPLIGRSALANLYLNTGHGTLGWTMACGAGSALADLVSGRRPEVRLRRIAA